MQDQKTWTITEIRNGDRVEVATNVSNDDAMAAIRAAMYGTGAESLVTSAQVHDELPLVA
jgi:hypothetical protein